MLAGCRDTLCDGAEPYCEGQTIHVCDDQHDDMHWYSMPCDGYCVETATRAFCASEAEPRAACAGVERGTKLCDGAQRIECLSDGYVKVLQTCDAPELCQADLYVGCTVLPGPVPECMARMNSPETPTWFASFCDGSTSYRCEGPYAIQKHECSSLQLCSETAHYGGCTHTMPDPLCTNASAVYPYPICEDNTSKRCLGQYLLIDFNLGCNSGTCLATGGCQG